MLPLMLLIYLRKFPPSPLPVGEGQGWGNKRNHVAAKVTQ